MSDRKPEGPADRQDRAPGGRAARMRQFYETSEAYCRMLGADSSADRSAALDVYVRLVESLAVEGRPILDVGCGRGITTMRLWRSGRHVTGVDLSSSFLARAMELSKGPTFAVASADRLPFRDATFGTVGLNDVIEHVVDVPAVLRELLRVTAPGGRIVIVSPNLLTPLRPIKAIFGLDRVTLAFYGSRVRAAAAILGNSLELLKKRLRRRPEFLYRRPDLEHFQGPDDDAAYLCTSRDVLLWLRERGLSASRVPLPFESRTALARVRNEIAFRLPDLDKAFAVVATRDTAARG